MPVLSGKDGTLFVGAGEAAPLVHWRLERTAANKHYVANDTGGARRRLPGARDCSGSFEIKAAAAGRAPVEEGDVVLLKLHADASGDNYYEAPAVIDRVRVEVDVSEGRTVAWLVDFSGDGPVTAHGILARE